MALFFTGLLAIGSLWAAGDAPIDASLPGDMRATIQAQQAKIPRIEELIRRLDIRPGTTILDIGAGSGQQSYRLAEKLAGTGQVYSTDIDPRMVDYILAQARERHLKNLQAFHVRRDGLDPFYREHHYDLILLYDVHSWIHDRVPYYRELKKYLNPKGRLVIIQGDTSLDRNFHAEDFKDWGGFISSLKKESLDAPFGRRLRGPLQPILNQSKPDDEFLKRMTLFHLNRLLDTVFFSEFTTNDGSDFKKDIDFTPTERSQAHWMLLRMKVEGYPKEKYAEESRVGIYGLGQLLNKLLIIQHYRTFLLDRAGEPPYYSSAPESMWYLDHDPIINELRSAGYRLEEKRSFPPFQAIWIFEAA